MERCEGMILKKNSDEVAFEAIGLGEGDEPTVLPMCKAAARSNPKRAVHVGKKRANQIVGKPIRGGICLDLGAFDVVKAIGRTYPHTAICCWCQGKDNLAE